ncbi:MAG TPA: DUF445 family protein [Thermodesulfobacteriota bacterium]|nr:DUF445 family protein [Thermodesulfobacteriota bacterium]
MAEASIISDYRFFLPPVVGAIIGWITNYVAIKLLFRPHLPVKVFGYKFQGLIPKRRKEIARSIARTIEREILSSEDVASMLKTVKWKEAVENIIEDMVEHRLGSRTLSKIPVIGLASENLRYHIKYLLAKEVVTQIDKNKDELVARFKDNVDINELVVSRIDNLNFERFESLLTDFIARELKHLEYLGGVMGFIIGSGQSLIFLLFH